MNKSEVMECKEAMLQEEALARSERKWLSTAFRHIGTGVIFSREEWYLLGHDPDEEEELEEIDE